MTYDPTLNELRKQWREESRLYQEWAALQDVMFDIKDAPINNGLREKLMGEIETHMRTLLGGEAHEQTGCVSE